MKNPHTVYMRTMGMDEYIIHESEHVRIGFSNVYLFVREEIDGEDRFPRLIVRIAGQGINAEIDTCEPAFGDQISQLENLVKLLKTYA